jgi:repressor LexA
MKQGKRQKEIYIFIQTFIKENKFSPTVREIADAVNLKSSSTAHKHLNKLRKEGYITFIDSLPRTIQVIHEKEVEFKV